MPQDGSSVDFSYFERPSSVASSFEPVETEDYQHDIYQRRVRLKQSIDAAVDAGASVHIELPRVIVVGSQSSGKSSLFEGISGIPLPRSTGTCTRCPIICRMSSKLGPWSCRIRIMREVDAKGNALSNPQCIPFGSTINNPSNVCERIRRAQVAILHPRRDPREFLEASYLPENEDGGFSFDSIIVDVEGPGVIDLSFVDLPGIIADDGGGNDNVQRVKDMAIKHIANESSLILLVIQCSDDIKNQGSIGLARQYDPERKRTILVMTKPDRIEAGQEEPWQLKLRDRDQCFCVRQPGPNELRPSTLEESNQQEMGFFRAGPWAAEYNDPPMRRRLGVKNLTNYLNTRLLDWIATKLPKMQGELRQELRKIQAEITRLPAAISDPVRHTNVLIWELCKVLSEAVDMYNFKIPTLVGTCRRRIEEFTDVLVYHLFPRFRPFSFTQGSNIFFEEFPESLANIPELPHSLPAAPDNVYLDEVTNRCEVGRTREMPGNYPYGVQKELMEASVEIWRNETESMLEDVFQNIIQELQTRVFKHFSVMKGSGQDKFVWNIVKEHVESRRDSVKRALQASLDREKTCSLIYDRAEYSHYKRTYVKHYRSQHPSIVSSKKISADDAIHAAAEVASQFPHPVVSTTGKIVANVMEKRNSRNSRNSKDYPLSDDEEHGISVMAETRAFYHIAVRRYGSSAAQMVFHDLLLNIQDGPELEQKLRDEIGISGPDVVDRCREFVEPCSETIMEREDLNRRQTLLQDILDQFIHFQRSKSF